MPDEQTVLLDLNNPVFQEALFSLPKAEKMAALDTLRKLRAMTWPEVYCDKGLRWGEGSQCETAFGDNCHLHCTDHTFVQGDGLQGREHSPFPHN